MSLKIIWSETKPKFNRCKKCGKFRQIYCACKENCYCYNCGVVEARNFKSTPPNKVSKVIKEIKTQSAVTVDEQHRQTILGYLKECPCTIYDLAPLIKRTSQTAYFHCRILEKQGVIESYRPNRNTPLTYCIKGEREKLHRSKGLTTWQKILNVLEIADKPLTTMEIARRAKTTHQAVRSMSTKMHEQGMIDTWVVQARYHAKYHALTKR